MELFISFLSEASQIGVKLTTWFNSFSGRIMTQLSENTLGCRLYSLWFARAPSPAQSPVSFWVTVTFRSVGGATADIDERSGRPSP